MDLDCFGSMVLARYLYPGYSLVKSRFIHPVARNVYNLYQNRLNLITAGDLKGQTVDHMVVVDTRSYNRIKEFLSVLKELPRKIEIYDHHPSDTGDIENAKIHYEEYGSNTTLLGTRLIKRGITITPDDATIALAGIYADTGNFTHQNISPVDFDVASFLMKQGASLEITRKLLESLKEKYQIAFFHEILNRLTYKDINGNMVLLSYLEIEKQESGLAAVVDKIFEIENPDAFFAVFSCKKEQDVLIIARGQKQEINLTEILNKFGGGGHRFASSAYVKNKSGITVFAELETYLYEMLLPALQASDIMTNDQYHINQNKTLLDASILMEKIDHTGLPVISDRGQLIGVITLRDIMKGRRANQMNAPVKSYMSKEPISAEPRTSIREIEELFYNNNVGHIPVLQGTKIIGIVTRSDYLNYIKKSK